MEIERKCFNNKLYIFCVSIGVKSPPPNLIIILNNEGDKKIFLLSLFFKINMINMDSVEVSDFNIYLISFYPKNSRIYSPTESIVFGIPIPSKSPILSLFKSFFLLINKSVLQRLLFVIN